MANDTRTLSERIGALAYDADQLHSLIRELGKETDKIEGIETVDHLADVPGELLEAERYLAKAVDALNDAEQDAIKGGD